MTVEVNSTMTTRQSIAIAQIIPQYRYTQGLGRRRLLTPDEVLRLPNDQLLIIIRGQKILRAKKFDYTGHPYAKECVKTSIRDYPQLQCTPAVDPEPAPEALETIPAPAPEEPVPPAEPEAAPAVAPAETPKRARRRPTLYESAKPPSDF